MNFTIPAGIKIYKVSELNFEIKNEIENSYFNIWIEGEISNFAYPNNKHMYFSLVDDVSMIKVAMFENNCKNLVFKVEDGLHVYVNGYVSIYDKRSEYQIIANNIIPIKKGSLMLAFEQLKKKLQDFGFFDEENKKFIPRLPSKIGVITSKSGSVIRDIIKILNKRYGNYHLVIRNTPVQGYNASEEICAAIDNFEEYRVDVIIIARGGGSFEDLAPFNDEKLAKRIFNCAIPIISGVGHQTDFTICDFVADKRAATPTHAAELAILNKKDEIFKIRKDTEKLFNLILQKTSLCKKELKTLKDKKVFKQPETILNFLWQYYDHINTDLKNNYKNIVKLSESRFKITETKVNLKIISTKIVNYRMGLRNKSVFLKRNIQSVLNIKKNIIKINLEKINLANPINILSRGFSIAKNKKTGKIIKSLNDVNINDIMSVLLKDGFVDSKVITKKAGNLNKQ